MSPLSFQVAVLPTKISYIAFLVSPSDSYILSFIISLILLP